MRGKSGLWLALTFLTIQVASSSWWIWKCCERKKESIKLKHELPRNRISSSIWLEHIETTTESSFQKTRWFQYWMLRSQRKVPGHITRLILSYLTFVPVTSQLCPHRNGLKKVAISRNCRWLLSTAYPNSLYLSDLATGERVRTFTGPTRNLHFLSCTIADNHAFVAAAGESANIYVWNISSEKLVATLIVPTNRVNTCSFFFNDTRIASGSDDAVRVWQVEHFQWKNLYVLKGHTNRINSIFTFQDNPRIISSAWDYTLRVWNSDTGTCLQILTGHIYIPSKNACVMSLDHQLVGSIDWLGSETKLWDITTGACTLTIQSISGSWDWDHHIVYLSSRRLVWWQSDQERNKVGVWNLQENKNIYTLPFKVQIKLVNVSADGKYLIIVLNRDNTEYAFVQVHDFETGRIILSCD